MRGRAPGGRDEEGASKGGEKRKQEEAHPHAGRPLGQVCTSISAVTVGEMAEKAASAFALGSDLVELRVDLLRERAGAELPRTVAHLARRAIVTVRRSEEGGGFQGTEEERLALIQELCGLRPAFVDVELSTVEESPKWYGGLPGGPKRIVSWHDFRSTPSLATLRRLRDRARSRGDVVKIVTAARAGEDNLRVLRLYERYGGELVAFCMGETGVLSRLVSLQLGSPINYAALPDEPVAPGQPSVTTLVGLKRMWRSEGPW
ncbi:MAG: type I 3-dehydroquinate dehydratase [Nitrososphaerales archaeon]